MLPGQDDAHLTAGTSAGTQSLYRKYRPTSFDSAELVGQDHIVRTLRNAIARERVAHAYLFCGPRGTGKTSTARLLAKAVNCLDPDPERRPCNACEACIAINEARATDIIEIDAASNRGIDDMRDLREKVRYAPSQLRTKFYIIDEAHQLTKEAFNAFLKTLEEPPPNTVFVLATTDVDKLPDTIASRCQRFDFRRIAPDVMAQHVRGVCEREGICIDEDALDIVVRRAFGGMRDALSLVDQLATAAGETSEGVITIDLVRRMLGISAEGWEYDLAEALAGRDVPGGLRVISQAVDGGQDMRSFGRRVLDLLRLMLLVRAGADPVEAKGNQRLVELAGRFELPELLAIIRHFHDIDYKIRTGGFPQLPIELAFLGALVEQPRGIASANVPVALLPDVGRPAEHVPHARPHAPARETATPHRERPSGSVPSRQPAATSWSAPPRAERAADPVAREPVRPMRAGPPSAVVQTLIAGWERIRTEVKAVDRKVEALMRETDPVEVQGNDLRVVAAYPFHASKLNDPRIRQIIEDAIERVIGTRLAVTVVAREELQQSTVAAPASPALQETSPAWGGSNGYVAPASGASQVDSSGSAGGIGEPGAATAPMDPLRSTKIGNLSAAVQRVKVLLDAEELSPEEAAPFLKEPM